MLCTRIKSINPCKFYGIYRINNDQYYQSKYDWTLGIERLVILAQSARLVGERSMCSEWGLEDSLERIEVRMPV